jgi:hypothetical protein
VNPRPLVALALAAVCAAPLPARAAARVPTLPVDALRPGQTAVVRTVFEGTAVDTFSCVLLGVLHSGRADGDMILARALSERVVRSGVAAGMSGSPVYVDGQLIGALSSGWQFTKEPIFGITPIGEMLAVLDLPEAAPGAPSDGPAGSELAPVSGDPRFRELHWSDDEPALAGEPAAPTVADATPLATMPTRLPLPLMCSGLQPVALDGLARALAPLGFTAVPGGRGVASRTAGAESIEPGSAVAVDVMRGDLQLSAIGTVTWREGDRVLLFGHPFFQAGDIQLPLSTAEIVTIIPSAASSFKLGVRGRTIGVADQDRRPAVAGRLGRDARLMPLRVTIDGPRRPRQTFRFECIEDRFMAPSLIGAAAGNSLMETGGGSGAQTLRWTVRLYRAGAVPLTISDVAVSESPTMDVAGGVAGPVRFILGNPFTRVTLDSVTVDVTVEPTRRLYTLRSARLLDAAARPGGSVRVAVELEHWRGARETHTLTIRVPEEAPEGKYPLMIGGAAEYTRLEALRLPARFRPTSLEDAWRRLQDSRPADALYAGLYARAPEITSDGRDYPELPLSALSVLASGQSAGERGRRGESALLDTAREPMPGVVRGELLLNLTVDRKAP